MNLNSADYRHILSVLNDAAEAILNIFHSASLPGLSYKHDQSPVTDADLRANDIICSFLHTAFPGIPVLSEENKQQAYEERKYWDYFWLLDPLDGTKEFIAGRSDFSINLALCRGTRPLIGFIALPVHHKYYYNTSGHESFCNKDGITKPINAAPFHKDQTGLKVVSSRSHRNKLTSAFIDQLARPEFEYRGSAMKFIQLARGEAHIYPRLAPTMEWDTAAGDAILVAAGGKINQYREGNDPFAEGAVSLVYNKKDLTNPSFIAMGKLAPSQG